MNNDVGLYWLVLLMMMILKCVVCGLKVLVILVSGMI